MERIDANSITLIIGGRRITDWAEDAALPKMTWNDADRTKNYPRMGNNPPQVVVNYFRFPTLEFSLMGDGEDYRFLKNLALTSVAQVVLYKTAIGETFTSNNGILRQVGEDKEDTANGKVERKILLDLFAALETPAV